MIKDFFLLKIIVKYTSIAACCFLKKSAADSEALLRTPTTGNELLLKIKKNYIIKI